VSDETSTGEITELLRRIGPDAPEAEAHLFKLVYEDLRRSAKRAMRSQPPWHTLQTTALVGEAYLKLFRGKRGRWRDRRHFLAAAARAMRCILVDHARSHRRAKRHAPGKRVLLDDVLEQFAADELDLSDLDEALDELAREDPRAAQIVELRFFAQISMDEIAAVLGMGKRSVERDWTYARAWLHERLS
jgi:RNA polymerase sigma-70 factor (ECF subfamily)